VPREKIRKPVRQLTDMVKKRPARPVGGCTLPLSYGRKVGYPRLSFVPVKRAWQNFVTQLESYKASSIEYL